MSKTAITTSTILIILVIAGAFYYLAPDSVRFWDNQTAAVIEADDTIPSPHETITAKHQYKNGKHIIAGEVNLPTPCNILTTTAQIAESFPEQVTINFDSTSSGEACAQVMTKNRFKIEFTASENAVIKARWNGQPVELNLIPVGANEDLTNFEVFIKG